MTDFQSKGTTSAQQVQAAFDNLGTTVKVVSENMKMMDQQNADVANNQKLITQSVQKEAESVDALSAQQSEAISKRMDEDLKAGQALQDQEDKQFSQNQQYEAEMAAKDAEYERQVMEGIQQEANAENALYDKKMKDQAEAIAQNKIFNQQQADAQEKIYLQQQQQNNQLALMQAKNSGVYNSQDVQDNIIALESLQDMQRKGFNVDAELAQQNRNVNSAYQEGVVEVSSARSATDDFSTAIDKNVKKVVQWAIATTLIYGSIREIGQGIQYIQDLNKAMVDIEMVTGNDAETTQNLAVQYNNLASQIGSTTLLVAQGALVWEKQGYTAQESMDLLTKSMMLSKIATEDSSSATSDLTAILNGFQLKASDAGAVLDTLTALSTKYAVTASGLSTALGQAGVIATEAGISYQDLAAYISVVSNSTQKDTSAISQAFVQMISRMTQVKAGAAVDQFNEPLNNVEKTLDTLNISLRDTQGNFLPLGDVITEIAGRWDKLSNSEQAEVSTAVAGKYYAGTYSNIWEFSFAY